jgi:hypothetical protein
MKAPEWWTRELKALDPELRTRWSAKRELWMIERKVRRSLAPGTIKEDPDDDDVVRAKEGFIHVATLPPRGFSRYALEKLKASDLWSRGGWAQVDRELCEAEAALEAKQWADFDSDMHGLHREVARFLAVRQGRMIFSGGFPGIKE